MGHRPGNGPPFAPESTCSPVEYFLHGRFSCCFPCLLFWGLPCSRCCPEPCLLLSKLPRSQPSRLFYLPQCRSEHCEPSTELQPGPLRAAQCATKKAVGWPRRPAIVPTFLSVEAPHCTDLTALHYMIRPCATLFYITDRFLFEALQDLIHRGHR